MSNQTDNRSAAKSVGLTTTWLVDGGRSKSTVWYDFTLGESGFSSLEAFLFDTQLLCKCKICN